MSGTIRELSEKERSPGGFAASCCILHCSKAAEYVGTLKYGVAIYCKEHAEAFGRVNGIPMPWHPAEALARS